MGKKNKRCFWIAASLAALLITAAAQVAASGKPEGNAAVAIDPYYLTGSRETREALRSLFILLSGENGPAESRFAVSREIANSLARQKEYGKLINFLSSRAIKYPGDPYNSYYLLMIAYAYMQQDSYPVAARYFDRIIKNYSDLTINGESIHLACLKQLIELTGNPGQRVLYYQELISRFSDKIDLGAAWFMLGQSHERIGEWNEAIQAYTRYLPYSGAAIPGFPNADHYAKQQVDFNNSQKDWTFESLPALLEAVRAAMDEGSPWQLRRCQAKVNFFARSWEQGETDDSGMADFNLSDFMLGNRIRYADKVDASSNAAEAYLRTEGWSQYISTWYLYFRKIYFPSNPEIHGRWEWAGVYYGEKF